jgi:hypothetical protein
VWQANTNKLLPGEVLGGIGPAPHYADVVPDADDCLIVQLPPPQPPQPSPDPLPGDLSALLALAVAGNGVRRGNGSNNRRNHTGRDDAGTNPSTRTRKHPEQDYGQEDNEHNDGDRIWALQCDMQVVRTRKKGRLRTQRVEQWSGWFFVSGKRDDQPHRIDIDSLVQKDKAGWKEVVEMMDLCRGIPGRRQDFAGARLDAAAASPEEAGCIIASKAVFNQAKVSGKRDDTQRAIDGDSLVQKDKAGCEEVVETSILCRGAHGTSQDITGARVDTGLKKLCAAAVSPEGAGCCIASRPVSSQATNRDCPEQRRKHNFTVSAIPVL